MPKVHSHYDNLKVSRDASLDDIRLAYRTLTRQYHPDRNPDDAESARIMSVVNVAYGVLTDSAKRLEHDRWIASVEAPRARPVRQRTTLHAPVMPEFDRLDEPQATGRMAGPFSRSGHRRRRLASHLSRWWPGYGGVLLVAGLVASQSDDRVAQVPPGLGVQHARGAESPNGYVRPKLAPNGAPWPAHSGYVAGYEQLNRGGLSDVVIDNSQNDADVFAKLVSLDGPSPAPVRFVVVEAGRRFRLEGLTIGTYDLRYRDLAAGRLARTPAFILEEVSTEKGRQRSATTVALHPTAVGSLKTYSLGEADF